LISQICKTAINYSDPESLKAAMQGQDVVISMVGPAQASEQHGYVDAAIAAGVQRFFPSEFGPYSRQPLYSSLSPYVAQPKNALVNYLSTQEIFEVVNALDDHDWTIKHSKAEDILAQGQRRVANGDFAGTKDITRSVAFGEAAVVDLRSNGLWDTRLNLPKVTLEQAVRDILKK
jgi:hypothetical protein